MSTTALLTTPARSVGPSPPSSPVDATPVLLAVHLLGLVMATATIVGLIPAAILLLRAPS